MPSNKLFAVSKAVLIAACIMGCGLYSERPPEEWNDRYLLLYNAEKDTHNGCTLIEDGEEYTATFEDFLNCDIFQKGAKIKWTALGDNKWLLVARKGADTHRFEIEETETYLGNEGVDIVSWSYNDWELKGDQKTANFHRLMDSVEWHAFQALRGQ